MQIAFSTSSMSLLDRVASLSLSLCLSAAITWSDMALQNSPATLTLASPGKTLMNKLPAFENLVWLEREECAKAAEAVVPRHTECGNKIAGAIRARGKND